MAMGEGWRTNLRKVIRERDGFLVHKAKGMGVRICLYQSVSPFVRLVGALLFSIRFHVLKDQANWINLADKVHMRMSTRGTHLHVQVSMVSSLFESSSS